MRSRNILPNVRSRNFTLYQELVTSDRLKEDLHSPFGKPTNNQITYFSSLLSDYAMKYISMTLKHFDYLNSHRLSYITSNLVRILFFLL